MASRDAKKLFSFLKFSAKYIVKNIFTTGVKSRLKEEKLLRKERNENTFCDVDVDP